MMMGGDPELFVPNVGFTAGMAYLSNGDLVVASVNEDAIWRIGPDGAGYTLLSGLNYPNGLDVDENDFIYIGEQSGSVLRKVDPDTGEFEILASGLCNPNGVSFGPGYQRVYVGSFGCGVSGSK